MEITKDELDTMVERVATHESGIGQVVIDGEQGPWPGTKEWDSEVRYNVRAILQAALGLPVEY